MSALRTTLAFVECINARDVTGLVALASERHLFVDSLGARMQGRTMLESAWSRFFALCPNYKIIVETSVCQSNRVALFGSVRGTIGAAQIPWRAYAAWLSVIEARRVQEWRVFADLKQLHAALDAA